MLKVETGQELSKALVQPNPTIGLYWVNSLKWTWTQPNWPVQAGSKTLAHQ